MADTCLFCRIAQGEIPTTFVHETEMVVAFNDIHPEAPVHVLVIPRAHVASPNDLASAGRELAGELLLAAQAVAEKTGIDRTGWRLIANCGSDAGQVVPHLHFHVLGGTTLGPKLVQH